MWMQRLSKYPRWKLDKLIDYAGFLSNDVFKYLDGLQTPLPTFKALPEPPQTARAIQVARDFNALIQGVMNFQGSREERLKWEWNEAVRLDKKYPHLDVMKHYRNEKRFEGVI